VISIQDTVNTNGIDIFDLHFSARLTQWNNCTADRPGKNVNLFMML